MPSSAGKKKKRHESFAGDDIGKVDPPQMPHPGHDAIRQSGHLLRDHQRLSIFFFFHDTAPTEIYTLSLHDDLPISVAPLLDLKIKTPGGQLVPVSAFTHIESNTAPRTLNRFQQRNAVRIFGGVKPGVTKEEGLRVLETAAAAAAGPSVGIDYAGESRQIRLEGAALTVTLGFAGILIYLVLAAQFQSF